MKKSNDLLTEIRRCIESPYYFATTYFTVNGNLFTTRFSEKEFNKIIRTVKKDARWQVGETNRIKAGDWVRYITVPGGVFRTFRVEMIMEDNLIDKDQNGVPSRYCHFANKEEIKAHLLNEAKRMGYRVGTKIQTWRGIYPICQMDYDYCIETDILLVSVLNAECRFGHFETAIYKNGKWAKIISQKNKLPRTKDEFIEFLKFFSTRPNYMQIEDILKDYED